jgi:hypothetical protein
VPDEHHPAVRTADPGDAVAAVRRRADRHLDQVALDQVVLYLDVSHARVSDL